VIKILKKLCNSIIIITILTVVATIILPITVNRTSCNGLGCLGMAFMALFTIMITPMIGGLIITIVSLAASRRISKIITATANTPELMTANNFLFRKCRLMNTAKVVSFLAVFLGLMGWCFSIITYDSIGIIALFYLFAFLLSIISITIFTAAAQSILLYKFNFEISDDKDTQKPK